MTKFGKWTSNPKDFKIFTISSFYWMQLTNTLLKAPNETMKPT